MPEEISREEAKQLIDEADYVRLIAAFVRPKDTLGNVPPAEQEYTHDVGTFEINDSGDRESDGSSGNPR